MSWFEIYAWYLSPMVAAAFCYGIYLLALHDWDNTRAK
jgi:hypothetical protein